MVEERAEPLERVRHVVRSLEGLSKTIKRLYMRCDLEQIKGVWGFWLGQPVARARGRQYAEAGRHEQLRLAGRKAIVGNAVAGQHQGSAAQQGVFDKPFRGLSNLAIHHFLPFQCLQKLFTRVTG